MTEQEQSEFLKQWESVQYFTRELKEANDRISKLSRWDKNGSHMQAINLALDDRDKIRKALTKNLDDKTYEEWAASAKKISALNSRLNQAKATVKRIEEQIQNFQP